MIGSKQQNLNNIQQSYSFYTDFESINLIHFKSKLIF